MRRAVAHAQIHEIGVTAARIIGIERRPRWYHHLGVDSLIGRAAS
jgi:hypothetical protein